MAGPVRSPADASPTPLQASALGSGRWIADSTVRTRTTPLPVFRPTPKTSTTADMPSGEPNCTKRKHHRPLRVSMLIVGPKASQASPLKRCICISSNGAKSDGPV